MNDNFNVSKFSSKVRNGIGFKVKPKNMVMKNSYTMGLTDVYPEGTESCLYDVVRIGDKVEYDAGVWSNFEIAKLKQLGIYSNDLNDDYIFGGFEFGDSRNGKEDFGDGWRVISKDEFCQERYVTLINPNHREFFSFECDIEATKDAFEKRTWDMYVNPKHADLAYPFSELYLEKILDKYSPVERSIKEVDRVLRGTLTGFGDFWLTDVYDEQFAMHLVSQEGHVYLTHNAFLGIKVLIRLKSNVLTNGKNANGAWRLV